MAKTLRSVECGVCLRGEKICHFGVVVYSNVRERAPMRGCYAPPVPAPPPPPPPSMCPHTLCRAQRCASCRLPHLEPLPNTRNFYFCVRELSVSPQLRVLLIVSRDSWGPVDASVLLRAILFSDLIVYTSSCSKADALFWKCSSERCVKSKAQSGKRGFNWIRSRQIK